MRGVVTDLPMPERVEDAAWFEGFVTSEGSRLRQALIARFGVDVGSEVQREALAWAWEHRDQVRGMTNPVGYLYRVAQSASRSHLRWSRRVLLVDSSEATLSEDRRVDLDLVAALGALRSDQRIAVTLVHAYGWSYAEVADLLRISVAATTNHVHRGLRKLRKVLEDS
jgi:DNA-directed RNA polymerase specialized sigma24 family protein